MAPPPPGSLRRLLTLAIAPTVLAVGISLPLSAQTTPRPRTTTPRPTSPATPAPARPAPRPSAARLATPAAPTPVVKTNPFLPPPIPIDAFFGDLTLSPKTAPTAPAGFEPLLSPGEFQTYRATFGTDADKLTGLHTSGQLAFAQKLIDAATTVPSGPELAADPPGLRRFLLLRAAAIAYRSAGGFPTADHAVTAYLAQMDKQSPTQVGALWSIANIMARTAVTPRPDRIRYDALAAKANMQLALLLLDADQIEAASAITRQIAYHEGWLKTDPATRAQIARVRNDVRQTAAMIDDLAGLYQPALHNDVTALTTVYLYGRYVKGNVALVSNLPPRVPESPLAHLVATLEAAQRGDMQATFNAAERLRVMAASITDARIRARTLYAAMQLYDAYMASPLTERDRLQRTLARIAREGVVSDGARKPGSIDPFAPPPAPAPSVPAAAPPAAPAPHRPSAPVRVAAL